MLELGLGLSLLPQRLHLLVPLAAELVDVLVGLAGEVARAVFELVADVHGAPVVLDVLADLAARNVDGLQVLLFKVVFDAREPAALEPALALRGPRLLFRLLLQLLVELHHLLQLGEEILLFVQNELQSARFDFELLPEVRLLREQFPVLGLQIGRFLLHVRDHQRHVLDLREAVLQFFCGS